MSCKYISFSKEQKEMARRYYINEPLFNNVRQKLSFCYTQYGALIPEELWYEAKRFSILLVQAKDPCTSLCEYVEDMRRDLLDEDKDKLYITQNSNGDIISTELNKHRGDIESVIATIFECTRDMFYVMYKNKKVLTDYSSDKEKRYEELIKVIDDYFTDKMKWYFDHRQEVLDLCIKDGLFDLSPDYSTVCCDADIELYRDRNFTFEGRDAIIAGNEFILESYLADPVYGQCYGGIISTLTGLSISTGKTYGCEDYVKIYEAVSKKVDFVKNSKHAEIEITRILGSLSNDYNSGDGETQQKTILVASIFLIVIWDTLCDKSNEVKTALKDCRTFIEYRYESYAFKTNPLWKLVAKRIPSQDRIRIEDLEVQIEKQDAIIKEQDTQISRLKEEMENVMAGYIKTEEGLTVYGTAKKILILRKLLGLPTQILGNKRAQFKKLIEFYTKADDSTLERLLSQNELIKAEGQWEIIIEEYKDLIK